MLLTLVVTLERFYSVCHPLRTPKYRHYYVMTALIFTVMYNIPRFFEVDVIYFVDGNETASAVELRPTELRSNWYYVQYYMFWSRLILIEVIPYSLMITMNYFIWKRIKTLAASNRHRNSSKFGKFFCPVSLLTVLKVY